MIFDKLNNAQRYYILGDRIKKGFEFLKNSDLLNLKDGKYEIEGEKIYANIQTLKTKPLDEAKWEAHRKYIDIQYLIKGQECIGFGNIDDFQNETVPYDSTKDVVFLEGAPYNYASLSEGDFMVFYPEDVHAPMLEISAGEEIKKVIVKIAVE